VADSPMERSDHAAASPPARGQRLELVVVGAATAAIELVTLVTVARLRLPPVWLVAFHLVVVTLLARWLLALIRAGRDIRLPQLLFLATLVSGPIGATLSLMALPFAARRAEPSPLLEAWYERIAQSVSVDAATRLSDNVAIGRTIDVATAPPLAFTTVIEQGSLAERQTALGLIARQFHPAYAPALSAALKSHEPVVRVQAAAVAARVRRDLQNRVQHLVASIDAMLQNAEASLHAAAELESATSSALLGEVDRLCASAAAKRLRAAAASDLMSRPAAIGRRDRTAALALEDELLRAGRFEDFRIARRRRRLAEIGDFAVRPLPKARRRVVVVHA